MNNSRLDDIKFRALKQHVRVNLASDINFGLRSQPIYKGKSSVADFLSPAVRNLSLLGGGLGAAKGFMEPANDELGQPVGINQRLGNVALNAIGGGLAGGGLGLGYGALKPGVSKAANVASEAISNIPEAIQGTKNPLQKIQELAQNDIPTGPAVQSQIGRTFDATMRRGKRDVARTKRFFTGKGAGIETTNVPLGKTFTTTDPITQQVTQQFIPDVDRTGQTVTRAVEKLNPNAQLDDIATADRIAGSLAGGATGAVAGIGGGIAGGLTGAGLGGVLGGAAGTVLLPGLGTAGGAALGAKIGGGIGATAGSVIPTVIGGATGAAKGVRGTAKTFWDRGKRDVNKIVNSPVGEAGRRAKTWLGFEYESKSYPLRRITTFAAPNYYKTGAMIGGGLGTGLGAVNEISGAMGRQQDRDNYELDAINAIDNPYIRQGTYQEYTSPEQRSLRALRNGVDIVGRGALGAATGGALGVGLGGLAGHAADANVPVKKGLLERVYGK